MTGESATAACSLSGAELFERVVRWKTLAAHATAREVKDGTIVATYPAEPEVLDELRNLIAAEAACCPFLDFDVDERPDETIVKLDIPAEMREGLAPLLGL